MQEHDKSKMLCLEHDKSKLSCQEYDKSSLSCWEHDKPELSKVWQGAASPGGCEEQLLCNSGRSDRLLPGVDADWRGT